MNLFFREFAGVVRLFIYLGWWNLPIFNIVFFHTHRIRHLRLLQNLTLNFQRVLSLTFLRINSVFRLKIFENLCFKFIFRILFISTFLICFQWYVRPNFLKILHLFFYFFVFVYFVDIYYIFQLSNLLINTTNLAPLLPETIITI